MTNETRSYKATHEQARPKPGVAFYCGDFVTVFFWSTLTHVGYREDPVPAKDLHPLETVMLFFHQQMTVAIKGYRLSRMVTDCQQFLTDYVQVSSPETVASGGKADEPLVLSIEVQPMGKELDERRSPGQ